jgi:hypothetical protein
MLSSQLVRWGALGALLAATAWTISGIMALVLVQPPATNMGPVGSLSWYLIESSDAIAEVGMMGAVVGLHARQTPNYGRLGMAGSTVAFFGAAFAALSTVLWLLTHNGDGIVGLLFSLGGPGTLVGFPILGVATLRAGVLPRWCGLLLVGWLVYFPPTFCCWTSTAKHGHCSAWCFWRWVTHSGRRGVWQHSNSPACARNSRWPGS